jgi:hypothetical protein
MNAVLKNAPSDLLAEELLSLSQARATLPHRPAIQTVHRWVQPGIRGVRLEVVRTGGRTYTSRQALARFFNKLTDPAGTVERDARGRDDRAHERAVAQLEREGL